MSKVLSASCSGGVVTVAGAIVQATILSEGIGNSEGVVILDKDKAFYIATNATDLKTTLQKISDALAKIGETLTAIGAGMTGPTTTPPPTLPVSVAQINLIVTELNALKDALK